MKRLLTVLITLALLSLTAVAAQANPAVVVTSPANGATNVDPAISEIWVGFNDFSMDKSSFTGSNAGRVSVDNGASYTVSKVDGVWPAASGDFIKISLTKVLKYSTTYTVIIDYRVKNSSGDKMGTNYVFTFTTKAKPVSDTTPPVVESTSPVSSAVDVPVTAVITATFSEVMTDTTINSTNFKINNGAVTGTVTLDTTGKVATFTPTSSLSSFTTYTATITTGVKDSSGNALASAYSWSFRTMAVDTVKPTVTYVTPISGATSIDPATVITATFSESMLDTTMTSANISVSGGVTGVVSYDPTTWTLTFTPSSALAYGTNYTVTISTGAKDLAGNTLATAKSWTFTTMAPSNAPPLNDYCQIPPYVTSANSLVKPNVLVMVDNSGSMYEFAHKSEKPGSGNSFPDDSYNPAKPYFGYFDSTKMYLYSTSSGGYFYQDPSASVVTDTTKFLSGNFLNWLTMRRVDVIRKVLVGGKTQPRSANTANYLYATESPDRDFYKTYNNVNYIVQAGTSTEVIKDTAANKTYSVKVYVGDQPPQEGLVLRYSDRINFGVMFFNDGYKYENSANSVRDGGYVAVDIGSTGTNLVSQIENTDPDTWTPLGETLYEATRYFQAGPSAYNGGTYSGKDPIQYACQKNFVLILTDGESTKDQNIPGGAWNMSGKVTDSNFNVKTWMDSIATQEGFASQYSLDANGDFGTYYLEGVAYWAHVTDMRSATIGKSDIPGKQNLTIYTVFAFDNSPISREILKKTAKYGGFNDYDSTGKPDKVAKWDQDGNDIPDTFYEASDGAALTAALQKAFNDILARVSSGTAASILSNSEGSGANILQAVFHPRKYFDAQTSADWIGEMHNMWYFVDPFIKNSTIREDSDYVPASPAPPHYLNLGTDKVINFYFNTDQAKTLVKRYTDARGDGKPDIDTNADGVVDSYTPVDEVDADSVKSIWKAGRQLWSRTAARTIYTQLSGSLTSFTNLDTTDTSVQKLLQAANKTEADKIISYVSGTDQSGYRNRTVNIGGVTGTWRLGDIVSSTPRLQSSVKQNVYNMLPPRGYGDKSYGDDYSKKGYIYTPSYTSRGMVYVGANDGMLHAFKLGLLDVSASGDRRAKLSGEDLGEEQWTFIPKNALPYLRYNADPAYNHIYYVDGNTVISDVSMGKPAGCTGNYWDCTRDVQSGTNWRTILVSSMGLGGASKLAGSGCKGTTCVETPITDPDNASEGVGYSSYFALDITNPNSPSLLWEFGKPSLGFSTNGAALVKISARKADGVTPDLTKNGKWFAVLASGPTGPIDTTLHRFKASSNQNLTIYILNLADGTIAATIDTLTDGTKLSNAFAGTINNSVVDTDRWNRDAPGHYQDDALYIGYSQLSGTSWTGGVLRLMTGENLDPTTWKLSKVIDGIGPVTTNVTRLQDRKNHNLWLYFGAGRYYYSQDDNDATRLIAALKEPCYDASTDTLTPTCTTKKALTDLTNQSTSRSTVSNQGWYINLAPVDATHQFGAERMIADPSAIGNGVVYYTTFTPTTDPCSFGGKSYMYGLGYDTGDAPKCSQIGDAIALVQLSTGAFQEIHLKDAIGCYDPHGDFIPPVTPPDPQVNPAGYTPPPGKSYSMVGKPPGDPSPIVNSSNLKGVKRILHILEH